VRRPWLTALGSKAGCGGGTRPTPCRTPWARPVGRHKPASAPAPCAANRATQQAQPGDQAARPLQAEEATACNLTCANPARACHQGGSSKLPMNRDGIISQPREKSVSVCTAGPRRGGGDLHAHGAAQPAGSQPHFARLLRVGLPLAVRHCAAAVRTHLCIQPCHGLVWALPHAAPDVLLVGTGAIGDARAGGIDDQHPEVGQGPAERRHHALRPHLRAAVAACNGRCMQPEHGAVPDK